MNQLYKRSLYPFLLIMIWSCDDLYNTGIDIISITSSDSTVRGGFSVQLACEAIDQDGDEITYSWETASGLLSPKGDSATWTAPSDSGIYFITCTAADDYGASAVASISIDVLPNNGDINIVSITASDSTVLSGSSIQLTCLAIDQDDDEISYFWESNFGDFDSTSDSTVFWTAPDDSGFHFISCRVTDDYGAEDKDSIQIYVQPSPVSVNGLDWTLSDNGLIAGPNSSNPNNTGLISYWNGNSENADFGWNVTIQEPTDSSITQSLQFKVEDSQNCGGSNPNTQEGRAIANIQVTGTDPITMELNFSGVGEAQSSGYDLIEFNLNGVVIGSGEAPGGGLGCAADSVLVNPAPIQTLEPGPHTLIIDFTTNDGSYHVDAYYEIELKLFAQ